MAKLEAAKSAVERAMFDPASAEKSLAGLTMTELMKQRAELDRKIAAAETTWLAASEKIEATEAA